MMEASSHISRKVETGEKRQHRQQVERQNHQYLKTISVDH